MIAITGKRSRNDKKLSEAERLEIIAAHQRDETLASIAARFGVSVAYVSKLAKERGEPPRGRDIRGKRLPTPPRSFRGVSA